MSHTTSRKKELLCRVRRIAGQMAAVEKALETEQDCATVLHRIAACRGAIGSLMSEVIEGHLKEHVLDPKAKPGSERAVACQHLADVLKTYLK